MCGILGVRRDRVDRATALQALRRLAWRGADDLRLIAVGDWWLGVARLVISDPQAPQPITDRATGVAIAFNGAVTDATAQRRELAARGEVLQGGNDAELVLRRYLRDGPESLDRQTGGHAFAIVDPRVDAVLLAVDPLGEKPLYVAEEHGRLQAFASSPSALEELGFATALSPRQRAELLRSGAVRAVESRTPSVRCAALAPALYRAEPASGGRAAPFAASTGAAVVPRGCQLTDALQRAVARCAEAEVPVGLCLSGGIDSACLAACLDALGRHDVVAYQFRAHGTPDDERQRARAVAQRFGLKLVEVDGGAAVLDVLPGLIHAHGLPLGDPSVLAVHALARRAALDGIRVLLSGEGADDLLLGYPRHQAARWLPRRGLTFLPRPRFGMRAMQRLLRAWTAREPFDALMEATSPGFRAEVLRGLPPEGESLLPAGGDREETAPSALARARFLERHWYLYADLLPKLDVATLAAGVEGRCPFLDPEVVHCAAVTEPDPREMVGKRALRDAFRDRLPPGHMDQPKRGFGVPLAAWLAESPWALPMLGDDITAGRDWIDADGLRRWLAGFERGTRRHLEDARGLYLLLALELYERRLAEPPRTERSA